MCSKLCAFLLKPEGFAIETATSPAGVLDALGLARIRCRPDRPELHPRHHLRPGRPWTLLSRIQAIDSTLPVIVMTAWGSVELAVEAMRRGARDFVQKPWENARLLAVLRTQTGTGRRSAAQSAPGSRKPSAARRRTAQVHRQCRLYAARAASDQQRGAVGRQCAHHRRAWQRQGSRRPNPARALQPRYPARWLR